MTRLERHVKGFRWFKGEDGYIGTDMNFKIIRMAAPMGEVENGMPKAIADGIDMINRKDYTLVNLPEKGDLRKMINDIAGRKSIRMAYATEDRRFAMNARFLLNVMETLHASVAYAAGTTDPVFFFKDDDFFSGVMEAILPVNLGADIHEYAGRIFVPADEREKLNR